MNAILYQLCRNAKINKLNLKCIHHGERLSCRSFSSSFWVCDKKKDLPEKHSKWQPDQKPSPYRKQQFQNPIERTLGILGDDLKNYLGVKINEDTPSSRKKSAQPTHCDVLIVGGGAMGSAIAYQLKEQAQQGLDIIVLEKDLSYKHASTVLSVGGIRQQFSIAENIQLSLYGSEFLRHAHRLLAVEGHDSPDVQFNPHGYLTLASVDGAQQLQENYELQKLVGAKVDFLSAEKLKTKFPWLNTDGVEAGVLGLEDEGWFDPWSLLIGFRRKAMSLGVKYMEGSVSRLEGEILDDVVVEGASQSNSKHLRNAEVILENGETQEIKFALLVLACGAWTGEVGRLAGIGEGSGLMGIPIPIEPRKRYVYCFHAPDGPGLDSPLMIDPNGTYFRREGYRGLYLSGQSPPPNQEPSVQDLEVDHQFFDDEIWPTLANRVPSFSSLKMHSSWAGYYDYNTFDQNAIVGVHPLMSNVYIAAGFSGHGIQHAAGVGRAITESIIHGDYQTINLERFSFDRVLANDTLYETNIV